MKTITRKYYALPYLKDKEAFKTKAGSFSARWIDGDYCVFSYWTIIAQYHEGVWYINDTKYSIETSKHQQLVARALDYRTDNAMHIYHCYRGISNLTRAFDNSPVALGRIERLRKESLCTL